MRLRSQALLLLDPGQGSQTLWAPSLPSPGPVSFFLSIKGRRGTKRKRFRKDLPHVGLWQSLVGLKGAKKITNPPLPSAKG